MGERLQELDMRLPVPQAVAVNAERPHAVRVFPERGAAKVERRLTVAATSVLRGQGVPALNKARCGSQRLVLVDGLRVGGPDRLEVGRAQYGVANMLPLQPFQVEVRLPAGACSVRPAVVHEVALQVVDHPEPL